MHATNIFFVFMWRHHFQNYKLAILLLTHSEREFVWKLLVALIHHESKFSWVTSCENPEHCSAHQTRFCLVTSLLLCRRVLRKVPVVLQRTAKKCTKIYNARAQPLFCSLHFLFGDVLVVDLVVMDCLSSLIRRSRDLNSNRMHLA